MGLGLCMIPLMTVALGMLKKEQMGNATGIFALARNLAGSVGIALLVTFQTRAAQSHQASLVTHLTPYDVALQQAQQSLQAAVAAHTGPMQAAELSDGAIYRELLRQSHMLSYIDDFRWLAVICFVVIPLAILLKKVVVKEPMTAH